MSSTRNLIAAIAGFAALGFAVLAVVYWAFVANPPLSFAGIDWPLRILIVLAILSFSAYLLAAPETIGQAASRRSNRLTANALVVSLVAIGIAIFLNVIVATIPSVRADMTAAQTFTLSDQSIKVLQNLQSPVNAVAFYSAQNNTGVSRQQIEDELKAYQAYSTKFKYEFVDPYNEPARATQYGVTRLGSVVFDNGKKSEIANGVSESEFTGALVRLQQSGTKTVAFLTGHGERDINGSDQTGYSGAKDVLTKDNYNTITWSLITSPTITVTDVTVLVIAAPTRPVTDKELQAVQTYLDQGGHMLLLLDPQMPADALAPMSKLLSKYGVTPQQGAAIDLQHVASQQDPTVLYVDSYVDSDITRDLNRDHLPSAFPLSMNIKVPTSTVGSLVATSIIQTSIGDQISWLETDLNSISNGTAKYDPDKDTPGPLNLAVTLAASSTSTDTVGTKIVVYGDADFPSDYVLGQQTPFANQDLFANTVSWLAGQYDLVSIRPKDPDTPRTIALDGRQQTVMFASTVCGLPLLILLLGAYIWWRRR